MKTTLKTSAETNVENQKSNFNYKWNPTSDSKCLKTWEEENEEYATWDLIFEEQDTATY